MDAGAYRQNRRWWTRPTITNDEEGPRMAKNGRLAGAAEKTPSKMPQERF